MKKTLLILLIVFLLTGCGGNGGDLPSIPSPEPQGNLTPRHMAYCWYDWPRSSSKGFDDFEVLLTIDKDPGAQSYYYWAHQFGFQEGEGGYMGLQTNGHKQGSWVGKMAIFSIWDALDAVAGPGASSEIFGGEGVGWSCRKKYDWVEGHIYSLIVKKEDSGETEYNWWGAYIKDTNTSEETFLGKIKISASRGGLSSSSAVWVEYYGEVAGCYSIPYAVAQFTQPTANKGDYSPEYLTTFLGDKCPLAAEIDKQGKDVTFKTGNAN